MELRAFRILLGIHTKLHCQASMRFIFFLLEVHLPVNAFSASPFCSTEMNAALMTLLCSVNTLRL